MSANTANSTLCEESVALMGRFQDDCNRWKTQNDYPSVVALSGVREPEGLGLPAHGGYTESNSDEFMIYRLWWKQEQDAVRVMARHPRFTRRARSIGGHGTEEDVLKFWGQARDWIFRCIKKLSIELQVRDFFIEGKELIHATVANRLKPMPVEVLFRAIVIWEAHGRKFTLSDVVWEEKTGWLQLAQGSRCVVQSLRIKETYNPERPDLYRPELAYVHGPRVMYHELVNEHPDKLVLLGHFTTSVTGPVWHSRLVPSRTPMTVVTRPRVFGGEQYQFSLSSAVVAYLGATITLAHRLNAKQTIWYPGMAPLDVIISDADRLDEPARSQSLAVLAVCIDFGYNRVLGLKEEKNGLVELKRVYETVPHDSDDLFLEYSRMFLLRAYFHDIGGSASAAVFSALSAGKFENVRIPTWQRVENGPMARYFMALVDANKAVNVQKPLPIPTLRAAMLGNAAEETGWPGKWLNPDYRSLLPYTKFVKMAVVRPVGEKIAQKLDSEIAKLEARIAADAKRIEVLKAATGAVRPDEAKHSSEDDDGEDSGEVEVIKKKIVEDTSSWGEFQEQAEKQIDWADE